VRANGDGAAVPILVAEVHEGDQRLRFFFSRFIGQGRVTILADPEYWEVYLSSIFNLEISIPDGAAPRQFEVTVQ
jgi:hypothetical protein